MVRRPSAGGRRQIAAVAAAGGTLTLVGGTFDATIGARRPLLLTGGL